MIRLVSQYKNLVFSICLKLTGDYFVAEDITQDTFITAYEHWRSFDGKNEKAWICRIASNKCVDYKRLAEHRMVTVEEDETLQTAAPQAEEPLQQYLNEEVLENLKQVCSTLSEPYDEIARLHFVQGLSAKEIAEQTSKNIKTVQTQIYRSRELLKKRIRKEDLVP